MTIERKVVAVTGATGAIGQAIAAQLAHKGWHVVLLCRNYDKTQELLNNLVYATGSNEVRYEMVDVSDQQSVQALGKRWQGRIDVLINNAAIAPRQRTETAAKIELQWATNVMGYIWMTYALRPYLKQATQPLIVNVASYWAGGLNLQDLEYRQSRYDSNQVYRASKQANRMTTISMAEELQADRIRVHACHPGDVPSAISHSLGFHGHQSPGEGAATPVALALGTMGLDSTGRFFEDQHEKVCQFAKNKLEVQALWRACRMYMKNESHPG
jgi:NAD(P)-dependent dehydrogenase (short-subunit alcohol dehydrogenase family)